MADSGSDKAVFGLQIRHNHGDGFPNGAADVFIWPKYDKAAKTSRTEAELRCWGEQIVTPVCSGSFSGSHWIKGWGGVRGWWSGGAGAGGAAFLKGFNSPPVFTVEPLV